jgi:tetratricopeptide (TPR) repeat protein
MDRTPDQMIASAYQARREGRLEDARKLFSESAELCREAGSGDPSLLASSMAGLGQIERDLKNRPAALEHYRAAVKLCRSGANPHKLAHTIRHLGDILREEGLMEEARPCYEEAIVFYRSSGETSPLAWANALRGFALLRAAMDEDEEAKALWHEARALYESVNVEDGVRESDAQIARLTVK